MTKIVGLLFVLSANVANVANAANVVNAIEIGYNGHFIYEQGGDELFPPINLNGPNNLFNGRFNFDIANPDNKVSFGDTLSLTYATNALSYAESGPHNLASNSVELRFNDNLYIDDNFLRAHGLENYFPSTYQTTGNWDVVSLIGDFNNTGSSFMLFAVYDKNTFSASNFSDSNYQDIFPVESKFVGFEAITSTFHGTGVLDQVKLSAVPVPASIWLFMTAITGLFVSKRKGLSIR